MQGGASSSGGGAVSLGQQVRQMGAPAGGGSGGVGTPPTGAGGGGGGGGGSGGPSGKRGRGRPLGAANASASAFKAADVTPAARKKKQKVAEKQIPDKVAALLPESAIYTQLLEFEARVDAALARKKLDIQEVVRSPPPVQRILRMYVFNTYANQPQNNPNSPFQQHYGESPSWTLRIMGRVLEPDEKDTDGNGATTTTTKPNSALPKFSSFFKRITIQLDPNLYPEHHMIVWDAAKVTNHVEGFEIKRRGDREFVAKIRLEMDYTPERFKLSAPLAELLGIEVDTRPHIIAGLWQYIKTKKLQNPADPTLINCDPALQKVLGEERIKFASISARLHPHLAPPQPIYLEHRITLSGKVPAGNACYDVSVNIPAPLLKEMSNFLTNIEKHRDIDLYDEMIASTIRKINEHRRRRAYFLGFSHSPVDFINGLIASQSRDLKMVIGQNSRNSEKERRSDFYNQPWVEDAVIRYLNRRPAKAPDGPGNNT